ncbi:MAG TPA: hypothetical protein VLH10_25855 [Yinghuangia sp.]|uniref:hypothetical protein n=1 Tax=Yinghuangia sp. YIM S10712 TaxID=3436930 RepID=UPI002CB3B2BC|nr:hypothetical protein [Yinghuangia sp.]
MRKKVVTILGAFGLAATALVAVPQQAHAASACTSLNGPAGGKLPLCKTWNWDGNDYDGSWRTNGPSTLPSQSYLQRSEDGRVVNSAYSGTYNDKSKVYFRICDSRAGCAGWW